MAPFQDALRLMVAETEGAPFVSENESEPLMLSVPEGIETPGVQTVTECSQVSLSQPATQLPSQLPQQLPSQLPTPPVPSHEEVQPLSQEEVQPLSQLPGALQPHGLNGAHGTLPLKSRHHSSRLNPPMATC